MSSSHSSTRRTASLDQQTIALRRKRRPICNLTEIASAATPLNDFLPQYPPFVFDRTKSAADEFKRLELRLKKKDRAEARSVSPIPDDLESCRQFGKYLSSSTVYCTKSPKRRTCAPQRQSSCYRPNRLY
ncbi:hypothetical protein BV22DRAFT_153184 [Leucogyrophana mollusca]|uniref:Uncharacterized protein n=1 Tax=Leucogyrophana mollusca TaxID=85980 RepID=A0ACB8BWT2_9AGAM|nr:hypothetical protein BV22DRAFT_153184 [Leucogyrophana mollusca]